MEWKELLPDSSLSHLDYESRIYDNGSCGTSMSNICYIIAEQGLRGKKKATSLRSSTERHGDFSESVVFHFAAWVSFLVLVVGLFVGACLVCLCLMVTPEYLSHLFSHMGELSIETKRIDDRQSFKRVRHRQKKRIILSSS